MPDMTPLRAAVPMHDLVPSVALCASIVLSTAGVIDSGFQLPGRLGFFLAPLPFLCAAIYWSLFCRAELKGFGARHSRLIAAAAAIVATHGISAMHAAQPRSAWIVTAKDLSVLAFFVGACFEAGRRERFASSVAVAAGGIILLHLFYFFGGTFSAQLRPHFFEVSVHQYLSHHVRFAGVTRPFATGALLVACAGLMQRLPRTRGRTALTAVSLVLCILTYSFASLLVPVVLAWRRFRSESIRNTFVVVVALCALALLWVQPLRLHWGNRDLVLTTLHPGYYVRNQGPRYSPIHTVRLGALGLEYVLSGYFYLAGGALTVAGNHIMTGVGGRNFPQVCPVVTMSTLGNWLPARLPHNQYTAILAEFGLLGLAALLWFTWVVRPWPRDDIAKGVLCAYLLAALAGEIWFQYPFAAFVACAWAERQPSIESEGGALG